MQDHPAIETERLVLRPVAREHTSALHTVFSSPQAMRFWHTPAHQAPEETRALVDDLVAGPGHAWVLVPRPTNDAVGLVYYLGEGRSGSWALGYILHPLQWGQGLMSDAVRAVLDFGFDTWDMDRVELWIDAANAASRSLAERAGFTHRGSFRQRYSHRADSHETRVYGLQIEQWRPDATPRQRMPIQSYGLAPVLPVQDVRATADYYRDKLGFSVAFLFGDPPTYGAVALSDWSVGGAHIHFSQAALAQQPAPIALYLHVGPGLDELCEAYRARGVKIVEEPATKPWGRREFVVADCNGYTLRFGAAP